VCLQWFNFCWYFLLGVSTGLDTLGSQAHGEGNPNAVISCCVSAITVLSLLCIPVVVALLTADKVAVAIFFQTPESGKVSRHTAMSKHCIHCRIPLCTPAMFCSVLKHLLCVDLRIIAQIRQLTILSA